ncbi:MAG: DUF2505 domain-containing protein [Dermatophilaceae bacterium]
MRLTLREEIPASPDAVYAVLVDPAFHNAKCSATSDGGTHSVQITAGATGHRVRTARDLPATGIPDVARSFVGDRLTVIEVLEWVTDDAGYRAIIDLHVKGAPLTLKGSLALTDSNPGTTESLEAELKSAVPFIGGKIEQSAAGPIRAAFDVEITLLREWVTRQQG